MFHDDKLIEQARTLDDAALDEQVRAAITLGDSPWAAVLEVEVDRRRALRLIDTLVDEMPEYLRDFAYVDYDERLSDDQLKGLLSGRSLERERVWQELVDVHHDKVGAGIRSHIADYVREEERDRLDKHGLLLDGSNEASLFSRLRAIDESDVFGTLIDHTHAAALVADCGYWFDAPDGDEGSYGAAVTGLRQAIAGLGIDDEVAHILADEIVSESAYHDGRLMVIWYGKVSGLIQRIMQVHYGNEQDLPYTIRWSRPGSGHGSYGEAGIQIGVTGPGGAGHFTSVPWDEVDPALGGRMAVTVGSLLEDVYLDGAKTASWTGDIAGVYLPAIMADVDAGPMEGVAKVVEAIRARPKAGRYRLRFESGLPVDVFDAAFDALLEAGHIEPREHAGYRTTNDAQEG